MSKKHQPPKKALGDHAHAAVRAGLGAIPIAGAAATELFSCVLAPPLERRRDEWMTSIGEALRKLEETMDVKLEELQSNDAWVTGATQATVVAMRNHQREKLEALKNAVLNSALPDAPDDSMQQMFLNYVDVFTPWHMRLLHFLVDPFPDSPKDSRVTFMTCSLGRVLEDAIPELKGRREFYDAVHKDLFDRCLVNTPDLHSMMSASGLHAKRTTNLGDQFMRFITTPPSLNSGED